MSLSVSTSFASSTPLKGTRAIVPLFCWAMTIVSPSTPESSPLNCFCPSIGASSTIRASCPAQSAKSLSRVSGRSMPGEETSSR